ncbi:hypothetical protein [Saccharothrix saharensis]|uniref:hypothetical protein n=1 Tax=Saccharothrix saharensis TaxID=571190 RepID=UPI0011542321|nr:hypothetical protein [Saccharothrix saharensis]
MTALSAATLAVLLGASLAAAPAQAAYGPAQPVDIQLRGYSGGYTTLVGRLVGSVRFDDGNSLYRLDLTLCRQSSYTSTKLTVTVNGAAHQWYSREDGYRPAACGGGHGLSGVVNVDVPYAGVVQNVGLVYEGLHFSGSTATPVSRSAFYDNPFN